MGSSYGVLRPGQTVTQGDAGPIISRDWFEYNIRKYKLDMSAITIASDVEKLETFWNHVKCGGSAFWYKEVASGTHRDLLCGPLADGTQTTFPIPLFYSSNPADLTIFDDGVVQAAGYTAYAKANLLTDDGASAETGVSEWDLWNSCVISQSTAVSADGIASILVDPDGTAGSLGIISKTATRVTVSGSKKYTVVASVRGTGDFGIGMLFYNAGGASLPTGVPADDRTWNVDVACTANGWTQLVASDTSEATATKLEVLVRRLTTSANNFYIDCIGVIPGDLSRWYLPGSAPAVVEFASAPAANSRITAMGTGYRLTRVRAESREPMWTYNLPYHVRPSSMTLVEDIEI